MAAKFTKKLGKNLLKEFSDGVTEVSLKEAFKNAINTVPRRDLKKELKNDFQKHLNKLGKIMKMRGKSIQKQKHKSRGRLGEELVLTEKRGSNEIDEHTFQIAETTQPKSLFPWSQEVRQILKQPGIHQIEKALQALLKVSDADVDKCLNNGKPNRAKKLACEIRTVISICQLKMQMNKMKDLSDPVRCLLSALLSIYLDLCTVYCLKKVEKKKKYGKEVGSFVYYILQTSSESLLEVVLQSSFIVDLQKNTKYLNPFLRRVILEQPIYHSHRHYLKHVLVIQRVKDKFDETASAELSLHGKKLKPLEDFHKWLKMNCPKALDLIKLKKKKSFMTSLISMNIILCANDDLISVLQDSLCAEISDIAAEDVAESTNANIFEISETDLLDVQIKQTDALYFIDTKKETKKKKMLKKNVKASKKGASKVLKPSKDSTKNASDMEETDSLFFIDKKHETLKTSQNQDKKISKPKKIATETLDLQESLSENNNDVEKVSDEPIEEKGETDDYESENGDDDDDVKKVSDESIEEKLETEHSAVSDSENGDDDDDVKKVSDESIEEKLETEHSAVSDSENGDDDDDVNIVSDEPIEERGETEDSADSENSDDDENVSDEQIEERRVTEDSADSESENDSAKADISVNTTVNTRSSDDVFTSGSEMDTSYRKLKAEVNKAIKNVGKFGKSESGSDSSPKKAVDKKKKKSVDENDEKIQEIVSEFSPPGKKEHKKNDAIVRKTPTKKLFDGIVETEISNSSKNKRTQSSHDEESQGTPARKKMKSVVHVVDNIKPVAGDSAEFLSDDSESTKKRKGRSNGEQQNVTPEKSDDEVQILPKSAGILSSKKKQKRGSFYECESITPGQLKKNTSGDELLDNKNNKKARSAINSSEEKDYNVNGKDDSSKTDHGTESEIKGIESKNADLKINSTPSEKISDFHRSFDVINLDSDSDSVRLGEDNLVEKDAKQMKRNSLGGKSSVINDRKDSYVISDSDYDDEKRNSPEKLSDSDKKNKSIVMQSDDSNSDIDEIPDIESHLKSDIYNASKVDMAGNIVSENESDIDMSPDEDTNVDGANKSVIYSDGNYSNLMDQIKSPGIASNTSKGDTKAVVDISDDVVQVDDSDTDDGNDTVINTENISPGLIKPCMKQNGVNPSGAVKVGSEVMDDAEVTAKPTGRRTPKRIHSESANTPVKNKKTPKRNTLEGATEDPTAGKKDSVSKETLNKLVSPGNNSPVHTKITPRKDDVKSDLEIPMEFEEDKVLGLIEESIEKISSPGRRCKTPNKSISKGASSPAKHNNSENELASPAVKTVDGVLGKSPERMHNIASPRLRSQSPNISASIGRLSPTKSKRTPKQSDTNSTIERGHVEGSPKEKPDNLKSLKSTRRSLKHKQEEDVTNQVDTSVVDENDVEMEESVQKMTSVQLTGQEAKISAPESKTSPTNKGKSFMKKNSDEIIEEKSEILFSPRRRGRTPKKFDSGDKTSPRKTVKSPVMEKSIINKDATNVVEMEISVQKMGSPQQTGHKEKSFATEDSDNKTVEEKSEILISPRRRGSTPKKLDSENKTSPGKIVKSPVMGKSVPDEDETIDESKAKVTVDIGTAGVENEIENTKQNNEKEDNDNVDGIKTRPRRSVRAKASLLEEPVQDSEVASTRKSTRASKSEATPTSSTREVRKSSRIKDAYDYTSESDASESATDTKRNPRRSVHFQNKMAAIEEKTNTEEKVIEKTPAGKQRPRTKSASTSKKETKNIEGARAQRKRRLSGEFTASEADTVASGTDSEVSFPHLKKATATGTPTKTESKTKLDPQPRTPSRRVSLRKK